MQAAFAAVEIGAQLFGRHGERLLGIQRNRTKAHGREHNGHVELDAGRHRRDHLALALIDAQRLGTAAQNTRVSMGSRSGSMEGLVTWLALSSR